MTIKIRETKNINILDVEGRIDINSSDIIETVGWLTGTGKVNIVLNLENVDMVDYNGLSILAIAYKNTLNHKGKMKLYNVGLPIMELFKIVKLDSVFEIYSDEESAIASFFDEEVAKLRLRRRFTRLDIHLDVKYKVLSDQKKPKVFSGKALNLSASGVYIYSACTLPINTSLELELTLPNIDSMLEVTGRVAWLADKEIQPHCYPGMGITFIHLDHEKEKAIVDFIDKNITHRAEPW